VPGQQRHLAAHDTQPRTAGARAPGGRGAFQNLVGRAAKVEIHLAPGLVLEDEHGRARATVEERLRFEEHPREVTRGHASGANKGRVSHFLVHS
jgi:hypothetical protein